MKRKEEKERGKSSIEIFIPPKKATKKIEMEMKKELYSDVINIDKCFKKGNMYISVDKKLVVKSFDKNKKMSGGYQLDIATGEVKIIQYSKRKSIRIENLLREINKKRQKMIRLMEREKMLERQEGTEKGIE